MSDSCKSHLDKNQIDFDLIDPRPTKKLIDFIGNYFFKYFTTDGQKRDCLVVIN